MPSWVHSEIKFSKSIMFVAPRYRAGRQLCFVATAFAALIGDRRDFPAANQFSVSAIQKSSSV